MTSIPLPARAATHPNLRALNVLRDLPQVADLVELCFAKTMDQDGESYLREIRRASREEPWLRWASHAMESASMPLSGFVWEENGRIVGNTSLIVFHRQRRKITMLANVAVHPEYRHRGIGRALAERAVEHARQRGAAEIWLSVRHDNPDALDLYADLGFRERARRTRWTTSESPPALPASNDYLIVPRAPHFWPRQREWLARLHPSELAWYHGWDFDSFAPGLWNWLVHFLMDEPMRQWAILRCDPATLALAAGGPPQAILSWTSDAVGHETLWLALEADSASEAVTRLLVHARSELARQRLVLEHPVGPADEFIRAAGFRPKYTLVWMRAEGATK